MKRINDEITLSILVTFCNQKEFIKDALNSIFSQEVDFNYEVLVGLDGEDNESERIINEYIEKYPNTKLFKIDNSKLNTINIEKASRNRLNLLKNATGKYLCFLDGDDYYLSSLRCQKLVDILEEKKEFIAVFHECSFLDNVSKTLTPRKPLSCTPQIFTPQEYLKCKNTQFSCFIFRNIFYGKIPDDLNTSFINDTTIVYYFLRYGKFYYIPDNLFAYRVNINSIYTSKSSSIKRLYTLLCGEINHKTLPQYERNICKKYKKFVFKNLKNCLKNYNELRNNNEIKLILKIAEKENCYFTCSFLRIFDLSGKEKLLLVKNLINYILFNKYPQKFSVRTLKYFNSISNFGDELNLYVLQRLIKLNVYKTNSHKDALLAIGSMLQSILGRKKISTLYRKTMCIWGTGFISPPQNDTQKESFKRFTNILALRGKLTKARVQKIVNSDLEDIVLGDPGLLSLKLINKEKITKKYKVGIIPHYVDSMSDYLKNNIDVDNYTIIDITENPIYILHKIAECETIFSSSLHGLIAADSLNIPNCWLKISDNLIGKDYKFRDYYSVYDIDEPEFIDLRQTHLKNDDVENLIKKYFQKDFKSKIECINEKLLDCAKLI